MDKQDFNSFPMLSGSPTGWEYFWHNLPFAIPGFFTFGIAVFLIIISIQTYITKERKIDYLAFAGLFLSFGYLALLLSLRSLILSRELLLTIHQWTYWIVLLAGPISFWVLFFITQRKYKSLLYIVYSNVCIMIWAAYSVFTGTGFTGDWNVFIFGQYPVGGIVLRIWAGTAFLGYLLFGIPYTLHFLYIKKANINKFSLWGFHLIVILLFSNMPSISGYPIYPMAMFFFIPMLILGYGLFWSESSNIRTLILEKKAGFYTAAFLIVSLLVAISILLGSELNPDDFEEPIYNMYGMIPLFSLFVILGFASYIAGTNPSNKINLYAAGILTVTSLLQIIGLFRNIDMNIMASYRFEQFLYLFFVLTPSLNMRLLFTIFEVPFDYRVYLVDFLSIITAVLTQTPYLFIGYYEYSFGRVPKSGPTLYLFLLIGILSIIFVIREWIKIPLEKKTRFQKWIFYSVTLGNVLIILNIPSVSGYAVYPFGNLQFIPVLFMAYSVIKFNSIDVQGEARKITSRYIQFNFILVSVLTLLFAFNLSWKKDSSEYFQYLAIVWVFLFLVNYISSFVVIRPVAAILDLNYIELVQTTELAEQQKQLKEESFQELDKIYKLQLTINSSTDIKSIFMEISDYFQDVFSVKDTWMILADRDSSYLQHAAISLRDKEDYSFESLEWIRNFKAPIHPSIGSLYKTFTSRKHHYFPKVSIRRTTSDIDRLIIQNQKLTSIIQFPLVTNNEPIGVFCINLEKGRRIPKEDIERMEGFIFLISGAIQRAYLFQEAFLAEREFMELGKEIQAINELNQTIIEHNDLDTVMDKVLEYLKIKYMLNSYYGLYSIDEEGEYATLIGARYPSHISKSDMNTMFTTKIPIKSKMNFHSKVAQSKKAIFIRNLKEDFGDRFENWVIKIGKLNNYLSVPLRIGDKVIGILDLSEVGGKTWNINYKVKKEIEKLGNQISSALDKNLKYKDLVLSKTESENNAESLSILNSLSKDFSSDLNLTRILTKLESYLMNQFDIYHYGIAIIDRSKTYAKIYFTNLDQQLSESKKKLLNDWEIDIHDKNGGHAFSYQNSKPLFLSKLNRNRVSNNELDVIRGLKINSLFLIPLIVRDEVIGFLDFYDKNLIRLSRRQRQYLVEFSNLIASAVNNSILVEELQSAYKELKSSQDQLIQSEKMAALGQLVSGVAHEINTPLGAIKASVGNITNSLNETIQYLPEFLKQTNDEDWSAIQNLITKSKLNSDSSLMNTKEMRKFKKSLTAKLEAENVPDSLEIADGLVDVGIVDLDSNELSLWHKDNRLDILQTIYNVSGFIQKSNVIQDAVNRASKIVYALKNYASVSSSEEKQKAKLKDGLETVLTIYHNAIKKGIEIETDYKDQSDIFCYPDELNQVWTNLIHNSLQAMEHKGQIKIRVFRDSIQNRIYPNSLGKKIKEDIVVEIEDNGPGIPLENQEKIFKPFFTTKGRGEGSGLGLHISNRIIEKHEGEIQLRSKPGETIFMIRIPALENME